MTLFVITEDINPIIDFWIGPVYEEIEPRSRIPSAFDDLRFLDDSTSAVFRISIDLRTSGIWVATFCSVMASTFLSTVAIFVLRVAMRAFIAGASVWIDMARLARLRPRETRAVKRMMEIPDYNCYGVVVKARG